MGKRQYSDSQKAEALAALDTNGGNESLTSRQLGIPRQTLREWVAGRNQVPEVTELRQVKKEEISVRFESAIHEMLDVLPGKRAGASLKDVATSIGILTDKMQLLKGEPTAINKNLTDEERARKAAEILERGKLRLVKP